MSGTVWISSVMSDYSIGNKQGLRAKFYGDEWDPPQLEIPVPNDKVMAASGRHKKGFTLPRTDFIEALAIFDEKRFSRVGDLFAAGPFYAVKGKLADVLSRFNLGTGGLIPFPIYRDDLVTPADGEFFLLNFGARKDTLLPQESQIMRPFYIDKEGGRQVWEVPFGLRNGDIALSTDALDGADLWFEEALWNKFFISQALVDALRVAKVKVDFNLIECRLREQPQP